MMLGPEEKDEILKSYKEKDYSVHVPKNEYLALKEEQAKRKENKVLRVIKHILLLPIYIVFVIGIFYLPYMMYILAINPTGFEEVDKEVKKAELKKAVNKAKDLRQKRQ